MPSLQNEAYVNFILNRIASNQRFCTDRHGAPEHSIKADPECLAAAIVALRMVLYKYMASMNVSIDLMRATYLKAHVTGGCCGIIEVQFMNRVFTKVPRHQQFSYEVYASVNYHIIKYNNATEKIWECPNLYVQHMMKDELSDYDHTRCIIPLACMCAFRMTV